MPEPTKKTKQKYETKRNIVNSFQSRCTYANLFCYYTLGKNSLQFVISKPPCDPVYFFF